MNSNRFTKFLLSRTLFAAVRCQINFRLPLAFRRYAQQMKAVSGMGGGTMLTWSLWSAKTDDGSKSTNVKTADSKSDARLIADADRYYGMYLIDNVYNLLSPHKTSENPDILWRLARGTCEKAKLTKDDAKTKKALMYEAFSYIERALVYEKPPGSSPVHKWYAILLSYINDYEGIKVSIQNAFKIRDHFQMAIDLDPTDATSRHLLGVWKWTFADMPTYQRRVASLIFATPPTATYEDALETFYAAELMQPNFYSKNLLYIGKCLLRMGQLEKAVDYYARAFSAPVVSADDMETKTEAAKELKSLKRFEDLFLNKQ